MRQRNRPANDASGEADSQGRHLGDPGSYEDHLNGASQAAPEAGDPEAQWNGSQNHRLPFHPAAEPFPLMSKTSPEFKALVADIRAHNLHEDIETLDEGNGPMILDGRNRYEACLIAGVEPRFRALSDNINPQDHLISKNLMRRSPSKLERAIYAARMVTVEHGGDRRSGSRPHFEVLKIITRADAARRIGVSQIALERASFILDHCVPELIAAIDMGIDWLTVGYADKLAHSSDDDQRQWLKDKNHVINPIKRAARPLRVPIPWTESQLKALNDPEAAVVFEKVASKAKRSLSDEKAAVIFKMLTDKANHGLSDEDALAIAAKLTAKHGPIKDGSEA